MGWVVNFIDVFFESAKNVGSLLFVAEKQVLP
jgi:hypothetical protein